jgi:hypothetical protein
VRGVRVAAVAATGVLLAACAAHTKGAEQESAPSTPSAFTAVSLPQGSVRLATGAHDSPLPLDHPDGSRVSYQDWSSPLSMNATMTWITAHMPPSWSPGGLDKYNLGRLEEWDAPANPTEDGPNLTVTVTAKGKASLVEVAAWSMPFSGKSANETLRGVTGATARVTNDNGSFVKPFTMTLSGDQAQRFAADINALAVDHPVSRSGLAGFPDVTLTFQTPRGEQSFLASRNGYLVQSLGGGRDLIMSAALWHELDSDIPKGQSSRPPSDKHPVLPAHIVKVVLTMTGAPDRVVTGTALRRLVTDLRPLSQDARAGICTKEARPLVDITVIGDSERQFTYSGNCDEVSPLNALDGQLVIPFTASAAFEADIARILSSSP